MKLSFAFRARTWAAVQAMKLARDFAALVAPWVAMPGDRTTNLFALVVILLVLATGLAAIGAGGVLAIRELLPIPRHEVQP